MPFLILRLQSVSHDFFSTVMYIKSYCSLTTFLCFLFTLCVTSFSWSQHPSESLLSLPVCLIPLILLGVFTCTVYSSKAAVGLVPLPEPCTGKGHSGCLKTAVELQRLHFLYLSPWPPQHSLQPSTSLGIFEDKD